MKSLPVRNPQLADLPPGRPSFITRVLGFDSRRFQGRQARRAIQYILSASGYYNSNLDGRWGPGTEAAAKALFTDWFAMSGEIPTDRQAIINTLLKFQNGIPEE